jgi:prevent-host-death family protein
MKSMGAREAKNQLGTAIDAAQKEAVIITKHGRPAAGLVSIEELAQIPRYRSLDASSLRALEDPSTRRERVMRWYGTLEGTFGSAEEVDEYLRKERESWDR